MSEIKSKSMNPVFKNILGVIGGIIIGGVVNMSLITVGPQIIPPPVDADMTTMEGLKAAMEFMEPKHFLFPWLAHALGSFAGGLFAYLVSGANKERMAYIVAFFFLLGGIASVTMLSSPVWFTIADLALAYLPMACLAILTGKTIQNKTVPFQ